MAWYWYVPLGLGLAILAFLYGLHRYIIANYLQFLIRIFQEKPLFIVPQGQPVADAEELTIPSTDGVSLKGLYLATSQPRKGVILFGLEFGSNRWACLPYCEFLRENGYDICTFEMRGQGQSQAQPGYEPLQWVTDYEVEDFRAALAYLKNRPGVDPRGIGFFGLSKGGSAGLYVACEDKFVRCCVTDGIFATHTTMVPYMRKWIFIYSLSPIIARALPRAYYAYVAFLGLRIIEKERNCKFPHLEWRIHRLAPRPLLMIHGGSDTYIKPEMAEDLFGMVRNPKELWLVEKAKHNQAFQIATDEYKSRVLAFFDKHLAAPTEIGSRPSALGQADGRTALAETAVR